MDGKVALGGALSLSWWLNGLDRSRQFPAGSPQVAALDGAVNTRGAPGSWYLLVDEPRWLKLSHWQVLHAGAGALLAM